MTKKEQDSKPNFEQQMTRLDEIVRQMEKGDAPLDNALSLFEEGMGLIRSCGKLLDEAEQKVRQLQKGADGEPVQIAFNEGDGH